MTELVNSILPKDKPRYLMGVGTPANILECIERGVDMFDCVMPTRNGRNGMLFTRNGIINIKTSNGLTIFRLLTKKADCFVDKHYIKAYLRHLFVSRELLECRLPRYTIWLSIYGWLAKRANKLSMAHLPLGKLK